MAGGVVAIGGPEEVDSDGVLGVEDGDCFVVDFV